MDSPVSMTSQKKPLVNRLKRTASVAQIRGLLRAPQRVLSHEVLAVRSTTLFKLENRNPTRLVPKWTRL